jgi:type IV secretion system protein TrbL
VRRFLNTRNLLRIAGLTCILLWIGNETELLAQTKVPSRILQQYRDQRIMWTTNVWPYANALFGLLAVIEFAWSAAVMLLDKCDLQSWTAALVRRIMWIGAFYALLLNGRNWIPAIIESFELIGMNASGSGSLSPSGVFSQGLNIAGALMDSVSTSAFFTNPGTSLALVVAAALTVLSFIAITIQFIVAMVESYIIVAAGFVFLGFGGSRWTAPYVERYIALGVATGVKIMLLYLLIGVGMNLAVEWETMATGVGSSATPAMSAFEVMGAALIFMMLCWQIPKLFAAVLGGSPALTGGDLVATTTTVGSAALMVGTAAAAGVGLAAGAGSTAGLLGTAGASSAASTSSGLGGSASVQPVPPSGASRAAGDGSGTVIQPPPPRTGSNGTAGPAEVADSPATVNDIGGEPLAGSGFEGERPASGFRSETAAATRRSSGGIRPLAFGPRPRRRPIVPSDSAPPASPPRLNMDDHD